MNVILCDDVENLGTIGSRVSVAGGYARNYLFPQRLAVPVCGVNKRRLESLRQRRAEREAHELNTMMELAKSISKLIAVIQVKTGEDGKMFGSVTSGTIADTLKTQFDIMLDKKKIHLEKPIHAVGEYEVELHLHHDVNTSMKVRVESLNPPPKLEEQPGVEGGGRPGRVTEKRGRRFERGDQPEAGSQEAPADANPEKPARAPKAEKAPKAQK